MSALGCQPPGQGQLPQTKPLGSGFQIARPVAGVLMQMESQKQGTAAGKMRLEEETL
jgi:hypothetical protein